MKSMISNVNELSQYVHVKISLMEDQGTIPRNKNLFQLLNSTYVQLAKGLSGLQFTPVLSTPSTLMKNVLTHTVQKVQDLIREEKKVLARLMDIRPLAQEHKVHVIDKLISNHLGLIEHIENLYKRNLAGSV